MPAFATLVSEPLFLLADAAIVGHLGTAQLAALGIAGVVVQTAVGLFVFLAYGTTSTVARNLGAGDRRTALTLGVDGLWLAALIGIAAGVASFLLTPAIVDAFSTDPAVRDFAVTYLRIASFGIPALLLMLAATGVLRGLQDTRTPLVVAVAANLANIGLNVTFVYGFGWGIAGSAIGTLVAQGLAALVLVWLVCRVARRHGARLVPHPAGIRGALAIGLPLMVRTLTLRVALLIATYVAASISTPAIAAHQVAFTLWSFLAFALDAIAIAGQAITGRLLGAGDAAAVRAATRRMMWWGVVSGVALGLLVVITRPVVVPLFTSDAAVQDLLSTVLLVIALHQPISGLVFVLDGVLIGAGDGRYLAVAGVAHPRRLRAAGVRRAVDRRRSDRALVGVHRLHGRSPRDPAVARAHRLLAGARRYPNGPSRGLSRHPPRSTWSVGRRATTTYAAHSWGDVVNATGDRARRHRMLRPRVAVIAALLALTFVAAACTGSSPSVPPEPPLSHPEVGWVDGKPRPASGGSAPGPDTPNIVYVLTDDLSWNLVKYMPHVRAMERAGMTFNNYFVTDSLCCPSRTSIFTGEFPHNSGVYDNSGSDGGFEAYLANHDEDKSFAADLEARGYLTGFFGKFLNLYHPTVEYNGQTPYVAPGWSAWDAAGSSGYNEFNYLMSVGHKIARYGSDPGEYLTSVLANKATRFISTSVAAHQPFMAEISTFAPHSPYTPAPEDSASFPDLQAPRSPAYGRAVEDAPRWLHVIPPLNASTETSLSRTFRLRVQAMQSVDRLIGRLQTEVERLGIAQNTYFVFNSDNGFHLGEYNLRAGKQTAFDTDIKVPLVVTGPGVPPGSKVTQLAQNIDLAPTFEDLAGATPPATMDGRSLEPLLHGQPVPHWRNAVLVEHHGPTTMPSDPDYPIPLSGNPPSYEAIRTPRYLYAEYVDGEHEFHDLRTDPWELHNTYATMPDKLKGRLHDALLIMSSCHGSKECWRVQHVHL